MSDILDHRLMVDCKVALDDKKSVQISLPINNTNRTVGTLLGSEVTKRFGKNGLPDATIKILFTGSAGQSFGAFLPRGISLSIVGDANDYVGKGLSGGIISVKQPLQATRRPSKI